MYNQSHPRSNSAPSAKGYQATFTICIYIFLGSKVHSTSSKTWPRIEFSSHKVTNITRKDAPIIVTPMEITVWVPSTDHSTLWLSFKPKKKKKILLIFILLLSIIRNYRKRQPASMLTQGPTIQRSKLDEFISIASLVYLLSTVFKNV